MAIPRPLQSILPKKSVHDQCVENENMFMQYIANFTAVKLTIFTKIYF